MKVIGINLSHDASVCLVEDGEVRVAIAVERLTRVKHAIGSYRDVVRGVRSALAYCLDSLGIGLDQIDYFVAGSASTSGEGEQLALLDDIGMIPVEKRIAMSHPPHHLAHAFSAFYASGFDEAAALICDAYGSPNCPSAWGIPSRETETGFAFEPDGSYTIPMKNTRLRGEAMGFWLEHGKRLGVLPAFEGIGEVYRQVTCVLGFVNLDTGLDDAGKTMGLAPYGKRISDTPVLIKVPRSERGDLDYSNAYQFLLEHNLIHSLDGNAYLTIKPGDAPFSQFHKDLAAQVQWEAEEALLFLAKKLRLITGKKRLVLGGGVFLNSVANYRILREAGYDEVFAYPASADDGTAVGAALYGYREGIKRRGETPRSSPQRHVFFGRTYDSERVLAAAGRFGVPHVDHGSPLGAARHAGAMLAEGKIVGLHTGGAEMGPRALGHRSILADPRGPHIKDRLNERVKFREGFRPFAPAVLEEEADKYFELGGVKSPFMLLVAPVKEQYRELMPGITHVDGTARVQTVSQRENPVFYELIKAFFEITGLPVVLNTSFNLRGQPIVETPEDALATFFSTQMDELIVEHISVAAPDVLSLTPIRNTLSIQANIEWLPGVDVPQVAPGQTWWTKDGKRREFDLVEYDLLTRIDGKRTVGELVSNMSFDADRAAQRFYSMVRKGLIRWANIEPETRHGLPRFAFWSGPA